MPQLKKLSVLPSSILPKIELGSENALTTYAGVQQDVSSYLSLFPDMKSYLLSSDLESDGADSIPPKPRKRQRLDHLSQEEKIMRRKMKNRVAAQTARDRKKARMAELEDQVLELETERKMLLLANIELQSKNNILQKENEELKLRLGDSSSNEVKIKEEVLYGNEDQKVVDTVKSRVSVSSGSLGHAEGTGSANSYSLDDAIHLLTTNSETDALLDILKQCSEDLLQCEDLGNSMSEFGETRKNETPTPKMVGTTPECMESNKELIHFDHIYYKTNDDLTGPTNISLSSQSSELSTKDCTMNILTQIDSDCIIEVDDSSEIPVICITEPTNSNSTSDILQFDEDYCYPQFGDEVLLTSNESKPIPSPVSSDAGYDSSFSAASPCSSAASPWDETLTELFPSLV